MCDSTNNGTGFILNNTNMYDKIRNRTLFELEFVT